MHDLFMNLELTFHNCRFILLDNTTLLKLLGTGNVSLEILSIESLL